MCQNKFYAFNKFILHIIVAIMEKKTTFHFLIYTLCLYTYTSVMLLYSGTTVKQSVGIKMSELEFHKVTAKTIDF